jgi:hypothetical protein
MGPKTPPPQAPDNASRLVGPPGIEDRANVGECLGVCVPMAPHGEMQRMWSPAAARGPKPLAVQRRRQIGVCGHTRLTELVEQETNVRRTGGKVVGSHG